MTENINLPDVVEDIMKAVVQIVTPSGQGTGFFIREDGLVITNKHVVAKDVFVKVKTKDGKEYDGQVCKGDTSTDYAFLFTNAPCKKVLNFADSDNVRVAESVVAIGHPFGYDYTVSEGIVSAIERHDVVPGLKSVGFLQLDAGINPGNSGGPLLRKSGEVLGMITMTLMNAKGVSFAIPSKIIKEAISEIEPISKEEALSMIYCNVCGFSNENDSKYCKKCGAAVSIPVRPPGVGDVSKPPVVAEEGVDIEGPTISCPTCSAINATDVSYCKKCGTSMPKSSGSGKKAVDAKAASETTDSIQEVECSACGEKGAKGSYCGKCGALL